MPLFSLNKVKIFSTISFLNAFRNFFVILCIIYCRSFSFAKYYQQSFNKNDYLINIAK